MNVGRNAAAVVSYRARPIRIERDDNFLGVAGEGLVDRVVDNLIDHVVQAGAVIGIADIHAGALAYSIKALEDLDRFSTVVGNVCFTGGFSHENDFARLWDVALFAAFV